MNHETRVLGMAPSKGLGAMFAILTVAFLALVPLSAVSAEGETPPTPVWGENADERLETCYSRGQEWYAIQDDNVGKAGDALDKIEGLIPLAQERGYDTGEIEALLAEGRSLLASAESHHAEANRIMTAADGFDSQGEVVDREAAHDTCRTGRDALANARDKLLEIRQLGREIRSIVRGWRQAYQPEPVAEGS